MSVAAAFVLAALSFQEALPEKTLEALKAASVYVSGTSSLPTGTGSGFLIHKEGDTGYVVTNDHVIVGVASRDVLLTFYSGTANERRIPGKAIAFDEDRDLAVVKFEMKGMPDPLVLSARPKLLETATVTVLGFPFGAALQTGERHPAVTVSRGSIASLRKSRGVLERVQIDGNINPGNSGGPVVDKSGALIGVTVSKILGTNIAFAIPSWQVEELLDGRLLSFGLVVAEVQGVNARLRAGAALANPLGRIKSVSLLFISRKTFTGTPKEGADGTWGQASPDMKVEPLKISEDSAASEILAKEVRQDPVYLIQAKFTRADGKTLFSAPREIRVDGPASMPDATPAPRPVAPPPPAPRAAPAPLPSKPVAEKKGSPAEAVGTVNETGVSLENTRTKGSGFARTGFRWTPSTTPPTVLWSSDTKGFYILEPTAGVVRKVDLAGVKEERHLVVGFPSTLIARSSEGVLIYLPAFGEVWVLDADSLRLKRKIETGPLRTLTGSPVSPLAYACGKNTLYVFQTALGRVDKSWPVREFDRGTMGRPKIANSATSLNDPSQAVLSADGKYLLLVDNGCLNRFRVEDDNLVYEERGPQIAASEAVRLEVGAESKYVALASIQSNQSPPGHPQKKEGLWVYRIGDFQEPVSIMPVPTPALAFDREAGCAYGGGMDGRSVNVFTPRDASVKSIPIMPSDEQSAVQILVHPEGRKFLWVAKTGMVWWVELDP